MNLQELRRNLPHRLWPMVIASSVFLAACGGSGGGGSTPTAGIGGTGITYGTVTGFGSILVNGRRVDDSAATVTLDDNPGSGPNGGIKQGMVIKATGTFSGNTGTATSVVYRDNLEAPVCDAPATVNGIRTLRVLGQTVILDATTIVDDPETIDSILFGDIVEVSGLPDDQERIQTSFIEVKNPVPAEVEVKGRVDSVNGIAETLTINALNVNFNGALIDNNIPGGVPAVGQFIEVKGTVYACGGATDTLTATKVELEPEGAGAIAAGVEAEVEGFVTSPLNAGRFTVGSREIEITGSTRYLPEDFSQADILVGAKVEVEGDFANGVLTAAKISIRRNVKLESEVLSGDINSFILKGLPGIVITTNADTDIEGGVNVIPNASLRVRGIEGPNNTVLATEIEDRGGSSDAFLQGAVDAKNGTVITILGIDVDTGLIPDNFPGPDPNFENTDEQGISRSTFLGLVQLGTLVKVKGELLAPNILWEEAELED
jgi:hypothetical protein